MSDKLNLIDTIKNEDKFSTFTRLMASSGASELISGSGEFTVFVPTNDAFVKIPESKINELLNETPQTKLHALLSYHILPGKVMAANLVSAPSRKACNGEELMFTDVNGLKVNSAAMQARNLEATNGVVHALDTVLIPTRIPVAVTATKASAMTPMGAVTLSPVPNALGSPGISGAPEKASATAAPATGTSIL
ncbi:MAG: hypothetical protein DMF63_03895 [Acidobacteria bacterium]|nr:MAG: hypothetical protein DMF63_03895 [Acidobacteriota bacterium]